MARKQEIATEPNTLEWRERVRAELEEKPRGERARMAEAIGISTGQLSETINESPDKPLTRYTRYKTAIDNYLWPPLLPPAADTNELRYLLDGITDIDRDLLRVIKDMDRGAQRKLAESIIALRGPKK